MKALAAILDTVPEQLAVLDAGLRHVYANEALGRVYGRTPAEVVGMTWAELGVPAANIALAEADCRAARDSGVPTRRTLEFAGRVFEFTVTAVALDDGAPGFAIVSYDVTERHRLIRDLAASDARLRAALDLGPIVAFTMDRDLRITWLSHNQLGRRDDVETIGRRRDELFEPQDAERLDALSRQVIAEGRQVRAQILVQSLTRGAPQWLDIIQSPLMRDGEIVGVAGAAIDITQVRHDAALMTELVAARDAAEDARRAAEAAAASKTAFFAAASHDLRQPFQALHLYLGVLKGMSLEPAAAAVLERVEEALAAGEDVLKVLRDMAVFEAGILVPDRKVFAVADILEALRSEFAGAVPPGLELRFVGCGAVVETDRVLVVRILRKLLRNALRFTAEGRVLVGCRRAGDRLRIEVHDTGPGVSPDQQRLIFEPFYQVGNSERDRRHGLGMGLALAAAMARLLRAPLTIQSVLGRGACFCLSVPLADRGDDPAAAWDARSRQKKTA